MTKHLPLLILCLILKSMVNAQVEKIDTDRPDQTESAYTVPKYYFQAELGFNRENITDKNYDWVYPTALLRYGLLKKIELRLEVNYRRSYLYHIFESRIVRGFEPLEVGFKAELWEEKGWIPKTSVIAHLGLATLGSKAFRTEQLAPTMRLSMQNTITKNIALGYNIGVEWDGFSSTPAWIYTFAPGFNIGEKWYAYIEAFGSIRKGETPQHNLDAGFAYYISNDVKLDISGGIGISKLSPKNYIALGGSFRFKTKKK